MLLINFLSLLVFVVSIFFSINIWGLKSRLEKQFNDCENLLYEEKRNNQELKQLVKELKETKSNLKDKCEALEDQCDFELEIAIKYIELLSEELDSKQKSVGYSNKYLKKFRKHYDKKYFGNYHVDYNLIQEVLISVSDLSKTKKPENNSKNSSSSSSRTSRTNYKTTENQNSTVNNDLLNISLQTSMIDIEQNTTSNMDDYRSLNSYDSGSSSSYSSDSSSYDSGSNNNSSSSFDSGGW